MVKRKSGKRSSKSSSKHSSIDKQRGGKPNIDLNRKDDTNYDS